MKGAEFERLARAAGLKWADLARELGVNPQTITHWRKRGVAGAHSVRVAQLLDCEPTDISWVAESLVNATVESLRKANLSRLAAERSEEELLEKLPPQDFSAFMRGLQEHTNLSSRKARAIESSLGLPQYWLDSPHTLEPQPEYQAKGSSSNLAELSKDARELVQLVTEKAREGTLSSAHIQMLIQQIKLLTNTQH